MIVSYGTVILNSKLPLPKQWVKFLCRTTNFLWEKVRRDFGEVPLLAVYVVLHPANQTGVKVRGGKPILISIGWEMVEGLANHEVDGKNWTTKLLNALGVLMCEELLHLWDLLAEEPVESGPPSPRGTDVVAHYTKDCEYRALKYAVQVTGQRRELLAKVEQARKAREC
jgi:hypothetical protein